jgi:hypothetical protein
MLDLVAVSAIVIDVAGSTATYTNFDRAMRDHLTKDKAMQIYMNNGRKILKLSITPWVRGRWVGVVLCHWGNIDPEEYVTWTVVSNISDHNISLEASHGRYIIGKEEALRDFNERQEDMHVLNHETITV